jgi:hypothetical protein
MRGDPPVKMVLDPEACGRPEPATWPCEWDVVETGHEWVVDDPGEQKT